MPARKYTAEEALAKKRANNRVWQRANLPKKAAYMRKYRAEDPDKFRARKRSPEYKAATNARARERYSSDPNYAISKRLRASLTQALRLGNATKRGSLLSLIGCSIAELKAHLERQFKPGMSWEARADWHIDHIRPCCSFDLTQEEQQRQCFHHSNLQPLWGVENQSKNGRWDAST